MNESPFRARDAFMTLGQAFALWDNYPVSPRHALVVPRRVVPTIFDLTWVEASDVMELVQTVRRHIDSHWELLGLPRAPDGYNVGMNCGEAAGQTVPHCHVHLIPRYKGDVEDPRGGVRYVIPSKANYLKSIDGERHVRIDHNV